MGNRYIYIDNTPERSNDPEKDFEAFVNAIKKAISGRVDKLINDGSLDILRVYSKLGSPEMAKRYDRLNVGRAYQLVELIKNLATDGTLRLGSSSWGDHELREDRLEGTNPGLEDMKPDGVGYNSVGGPDYAIIVSKEKIEMKAGFCYQDFGDSWDRIDTSFHWQYRIFVFKPNGNDDETIRKMLSPFKNWIVERLANVVKHNLINDFINQTADNYLKGFLNKQES